MRKPFDSVDLQRWFLDNYDCWGCLVLNKERKDCDTPTCFHHILSEDDDSLLNAAPMNNDFCHLPFHKKWRMYEFKVELLKLTYDYLKKSGYVLKSKDIDFIERNAKYYKEFID